LVSEILVLIIYLIIEYCKFGTCALIIRSSAYFQYSFDRRSRRVAASPRRRIAASLLAREVGSAKRSCIAILTTFTIYLQNAADVGQNGSGTSKVTHLIGK